MERPNFTLTIKPSFRKVSEFPVFEGERSAPFLGDLDADELPEIIIGNLAGGLAFYKGDTIGITISSVKESNSVKRFELNLYPNPSNGNFTVEPHVAMNGKVQMNVYNTLGEIVWNQNGRDLIKQAIDLSHLQNGIYLLDIRTENKLATKRFIIQR
jgi:hypothetical protein